MSPLVFQQLAEIRSSGETNMIDQNYVNYIARRDGYSTLEKFLSQFVDTGKMDYIELLDQMGEYRQEQKK